jgi:arylamine N-acetyltransferase
MPFPIVWYAWGASDSVLDPKKGRFLGAHANSKQFYYDYGCGAVRTMAPSPLSKVKHPQGMPQAAVIAHLAMIL